MSVQRRVLRLFLAAALSGAAPLLAAGDPALHIVSFAHEDMGYANTPHLLRTENRLGNLFRALKFCDETAGWPEADRYRYQQEVSEPMPYFLSVCTPEERARLVKYMNEGRISVSAGHTTVIADRMTPEAYARFFYLANRYLPDMLDVRPGKTAMINDVTGLPWSTPIYCESAEVPWLFHGHNACGKCDELDAAPIVRWTGAGGTGSVLVHGERYNPYHLPDLKRVIPGHLKRATPRNLPIFLYGWDFAVASRRPSDFAKQWNADNPKKTVRVSTFEDWFSAQEKRAEPPLVAGKTGPCQWMDQPVADAWSFSRARTAAELLPVAETWSSVALAVSGKQGYAHPWFDIATGWHTLLSNLEHTCGAACWSVGGVDGAVRYEVEQVEHREDSVHALGNASRTLDTALASLASRIHTMDTNAFAVFNPSGRARTSPVTLAAPKAFAEKRPACAVVDDATGETVPAQWIDAGTLAFTAKAVPALGYRTYRLVEKTAPAAVALAAGARAESPFYRIGIDPATGCVTSLFDKELGKELVKRGEPQSFNQYLRLHIENPKAPDFLASAAPSDAKIVVERGPAADIVRITAKAENTRSLEQTIVLWHGVKRVDFALRVDKEPSGRTLDDYRRNTMHGKEAVFVSLPFDIPGFKAVYQTGGGGVAEPVRDQFKGTGTAFHAVQHFADISNADFGVTVCPENFALVEFGHPRADAMSRAIGVGEAAFEQTKDYPKQSTLQLFLMNNMFTTNIRVDQPGLHEFRWSLRSHAGDWSRGAAPEFGEEIARPLVAHAIPQGSGELPAGARSFASVDAPNVMISTLKPAEANADGFVVRLVENSGRATETSFTAPVLGKLAKAEEVNLVEAGSGKPVAVGPDGAIRVTLPPFGVKTFRLTPAAAKPAAAEGLAAKALSDMEVALTWKPVAGAAAYRIHRGDTADFAPSPLNLVAITAGTNLEDRAVNRGPGWITNRLAAGTQYFYRVVPVSPSNLRGPACAPVAVTTAKEATCAPIAVADLHAILVSPLAPVNAVSLLWRSNPEENVTGYEIHRSAEAGFTPSEKTLLARVPVKFAKHGERYQGIDHQDYFDKTVALATRYHYRVRAVTAAGATGGWAEEASVVTKKETGPKSSAQKPDDKALRGNDGAA